MVRSLFLLYCKGQAIPIDHWVNISDIIVIVHYLLGVVTNHTSEVTPTLLLSMCVWECSGVSTNTRYLRVYDYIATHYNVDDS